MLRPASTASLACKYEKFSSAATTGAGRQGDSSSQRDPTFILRLLDAIPSLTLVYPTFFKIQEAAQIVDHIGFTMRKANYLATMCQTDKHTTVTSALGVMSFVLNDLCQNLGDAGFPPGICDGLFTLGNVIIVCLTKNETLASSVLDHTKQSTFRAEWAKMQARVARTAKGNPEDEDWVFLLEVCTRLSAFLRLPIAPATYRSPLVRNALQTEDLSKRLKLFKEDQRWAGRSLTYTCQNCYAFACCADEETSEILASIKHFKYCSGCSTAMYCSRECR